MLQLVLGLLVAMALHRGVHARAAGRVASSASSSSAPGSCPGVAGGIVWQLMFNEASYGFLNALLRDGRPAAGRLALRSRHRDLVGGDRQRLARHRLQHDPALRRARWSSRAASTRRRRSTAPPRFKQFWYITLPQLRPILLINTILISIFTLNTFDLILPLTGGGPGRATEVLALYAYNTVFRNFDLSNGAVLAVILLLISLVFTLFYVRLLPKES